MNQVGSAIEVDARSAGIATGASLANGLASTLDAIHTRLHAGDIPAAYEVLFHTLDAARREAGGDWMPLVRDVIRRHPVLETLHLDPLTRRAWDKPRGYPGDAEMIDFVYRLHTQRPAPGTLARQGHEAVVGAPVSRAVRHRLDILRQAFASTAARSPRGRVLALAAGHLREVDDQTSPGIDVVAVDQDEASLAHVARRLAGRRVSTLAASIRQLLMGRHPLDGFDLVYAAGLFDYLDDRVARRLVRWMFDRLSTGGTLLIANFVPETPGLGYLEAVADWPLLYRTEAEVARLFDEVMGRRAAGRLTTWLDPDGCIAFATLTRQA